MWQTAFRPKCTKILEYFYLLIIFISAKVWINLLFHFLNMWWFLLYFSYIMVFSSRISTMNLRLRVLPALRLLSSSNLICLVFSSLTWVNNYTDIVVEVSALSKIIDVKHHIMSHAGQNFSKHRKSTYRDCFCCSILNAVKIYSGLFKTELNYNPFIG